MKINISNAVTENIMTKHEHSMSIPIKINLIQINEFASIEQSQQFIPGYKRWTSNQEETIGQKMSDKLTKAINNHFIKQKRSIDEQQ